MTSFALKLLAITTMFCDHLGDAIFGHFSFFNLIGRLAFPIFAFQISEGFIHTSNIKKYFIRLGIFAILAQIPFSLFCYKFLGTGFSLNVFFTLFLGLLSIYLYDYIVKLTKSNSKNAYINKTIGIIVMFLLAYIAQYLNTDYGMWGVLVIFSFYLFKNNRVLLILSFVILCIIRYGIYIYQIGFNINIIALGVFTALSIVFISLYNGKQGRKIKYLLYFFYPIHLLVLYLFL